MTTLPAQTMRGHVLNEDDFKGLLRAIEADQVHHRVLADVLKRATPQELRAYEQARRDVEGNDTRQAAVSSAPPRAFDLLHPEDEHSHQDDVTLQSQQRIGVALPKDLALSLSTPEALDVSQPDNNTALDPDALPVSLSDTVSIVPLFSRDDSHESDAATEDSAKHAASLGTPDPESLPMSERYTLGKTLGRGGGGTVWEAEDHVLKRPVAVKLIHDEASASSIALHRFLYEAQTTAKLAHPGIIPVYDMGRLHDGRWFYAMQAIEGRDLRSVIKALRAENPEDTEVYHLPRLLSIFSQVCLTIAYAHDHGIIHRDLKPDNIMLGSYGEVYVADWGLAKRFERDDSDATVADRPGQETVQGMILGTPRYMSPEQLTGDHDKLRPTTDIYALGVMLYELLTLRLPFTDRSPVKLIFKILMERPTPPHLAAPDRDVPLQLSELCLQALSHDPDARPTSARHLAERIQAFLDGVEDTKRRAENAERLLHRAQGLYRAYLQAHFQISAKRKEAKAALEDLELDTSLDRRMEAWRLLQDAEEHTQRAEQTLSKTLQAANQSLEYRETRATHELLADIYWSKAQEARRQNNPTGEIHFRSMVQHHDQDRYRDLLSDHGELELTVAGLPGALGELVPGALGRGVVLKVDRQVPCGPVFLPERVEIDGHVTELPVGSYVARLRAPGMMQLDVPFMVHGNRRTALRLAPLPEFDGCEDFVLVPGGTYALGGDASAPSSLEAHTVTLAPFLIGRYPITLGEYCDFLNAIAQDDLALARSHAPRQHATTTIWLDLDEATRTFSVPGNDRDGDSWNPNWPAHMLSWHDAQAYCRWRSERDGVAWRLPTEHEWEATARGFDRRVFPWGNGFDPTLCRMAENVQGKPLPAPVGMFQFDRSPYGAHDMAGIVTEWTDSADPHDPSKYVLRGGGTISPAEWCRAAARRTHYADWLALIFGFRIARSL